MKQIFLCGVYCGNEWKHKRLFEYAVIFEFDVGFACAGNEEDASNVQIATNCNKSFFVEYTASMNGSVKFSVIMFSLNDEERNHAAGTRSIRVTKSQARTRKPYTMPAVKNYSLEPADRTAVAGALKTISWFYSRYRTATKKRICNALQ